MLTTIFSRLFKQYGYLLLFLLIATPKIQAQSTNAIDRYFQQYLEDDRFSVVYISPKVFQLLDRLSLGDIETDEEEARLIKDMAKDLRGLRILSTKDKPMAFYQEAKRKIDTKTYELLMTVRQGSSSDLQFLIHEDQTGIIREFLMLSGGPESFTLISFVGEINLNTITQLGNKMQNQD